MSRGVLLLSLVAALALATPAAAHKLEVFAAVRGDAITGYAFFIGGGRAVGTPWLAKDAGGAEIASGETDEGGNFRFVPPPDSSDITVTVDTREGHIASATVAASRFGPPGAGIVAPPPAAAGAGEPAGGEGKGGDEEVTALVEAAVQRQVEPLLERIEAMDGRLRFTDVMSGIFLIVGLAGIGLWSRGRKP